MTGADLMVALTLGRSNGAVLSVARQLAAGLQAGVIGVAAWRPIEVVCADLPVPAKLFDEDRKQCTRQAAEAEREFMSALGAFVDRVEWRARPTLVPLEDQLAREARSADLILVGESSERADSTRTPDVRALVMNAGRPVLVVPAGVERIAAKRMLVGWKDTRETHRAIADAILLLRMAEEVVLGGMAPAGELAETERQMTEVAAWLKRHGVTVRIEAVPAQGANAGQLDRLADEVEAGLVVIGAYGHLRQSRWVLGGVTAAVLRRCGRPTLLSR